MAEHLRAVTLRGPALRQITIFLRRKTQKGFFMEEKTKVTAAPTIAEKCGIKYKEVDGLYYPIFGESEPESYASLGKYGHRYLRALMKNDRYLYNKYFMQGVLLDKAAEYENYAWQLYDTVLQGISKERGIGLDTLEEKGFQVSTIETTGAGDTFCGCSLAYILEHDINNLTEDHLREMLIFANAGAALVTTKKGAICSMPERREIVDLIDVSRNAIHQF